MNHTRVIATLIICVALLTSVTVYAKKDFLFGQKPAQASSFVVDNSVTSTTDTSVNTSNADWRKTLVNLNVATDTSVQIIASQAASTDTNAQDNTLTAQMSKEFFSLYLADKKNGVTIDQNEAMNIANQTLNNLNITNQGKQYGIKDIKVIQDSSNPAMAAYEQALLGAIKNNSSPNAKDPIAIISAGTTSQNDADLAPLDPIIKNYEGAIHDILLIPIPVKALGYHLVYLNTLSDLTSDIQSMRQILTDPVTGYVGFSNYQKDIVALQLAINNMNVHFSQ